MQKLRERRLTHTPTVIPHDRSNCGLSLNSSEGRDSVAGLKTSLDKKQRKIISEIIGILLLDLRLFSFLRLAAGNPFQS